MDSTGNNTLFFLALSAHRLSLVTVVPVDYAMACRVYHLHHRG